MHNFKSEYHKNWYNGVVQYGDHEYEVHFELQAVFSAVFKKNAENLLNTAANRRISFRKGN
jgi:hypothetical protein